MEEKTAAREATAEAKKSGPRGGARVGSQSQREARVGCRRIRRRCDGPLGRRGSLVPPSAQKAHRRRRPSVAGTSDGSPPARKGSTARLEMNLPRIQGSRPAGGRCTRGARCRGSTWYLYSVCDWVAVSPPAPAQKYPGTDVRTYPYFSTYPGTHPGWGGAAGRGRWWPWG